VKRVLFVDDDPRVLAGLERMLRPYRETWATVTATDGHAALETLAAMEVDVIVTDMRMPGMDGAELLSRVRDRHPEIVRIVLSGQMDSSASVRTASVAHQYLSKPCDTTTLIDVIQRTCNLQGLSYPPALRQALGRIGSLPSPGATIIELNRVMASGDVSLSEVGDIAGRDPAITTKVLQLVNSAFFGLPHSVADIRVAITYLGLITVRNLFVASDVFRAFDGRGLLGRKDLHALQSRAMTVARGASELMDGTSEREWAFLAGLVHDVGILAMTSCPLDDLDPETSRSGLDALPHIEATLGASHADVGGYLMTIWGLPDVVVDAVANHHATGAALSELSPVAAAVHSAVLSEQSQR
jgi:HD-like signal output (HDOD) protein/CheY-like chemotaxis protein